MTRHTVYIGSPNEPLFTITNDLITDVRGEFNCKMVATEMPVDYFEVDFEMAESIGFYTSLLELFETADGKEFTVQSYHVRSTALRTPIWYFQDETCIAHMFLDDLKQTGPNTFYLKAVSFLAILEDYNRTFGYQSNTFGVILERIILSDGTNAAYSTDETLLAIRDMIWFESDDLRETTAQFFLPQCSRREALMQFLLSRDLILRPWTEGRYMITRPTKSNEPELLSGDKVYSAPEAEYSDSYDRIEVVVHEFRDMGGYSETVYETPEGAPETQRTVFFDEPVVLNTIATTGTLTITGQSQGGAIVTGRGNITARKYRHYSWLIARGADSSAAKKVLSIDNDICITPEEGEYCADNLWNYYSSGVYYNMDVVMSGESCGLHYTVPTPFSGAEPSHLEQVRFVGSELTKGTCRFKPNYIPPARSKTAVLLTGSGVFRVPDYVFEQPNPKITVTLVGGGSGGTSGLRGFNGEAGKSFTNANISSMTGYGQSKSQPAGLCGDGGRILSFELTGEDLRQLYVYSCGTGGSGGAQNSSTTAYNKGREGGATTFGSFSSASGARSSVGIVNFSNNEHYGAKPTEYIAASKIGVISQAGGIAGYVWSAWKIDESSWSYFTMPAESTTATFGFNNIPGGWTSNVSKTFPGGNNAGYKTLSYYGYDYGWTATFVGGMGGGAALGAPGSPGDAASLKNGEAFTGNGGNGGSVTVKPLTPTQFDRSMYGFGGFGGHSGGNGGRAGPSWSNISTKYGTPGTGGLGGPGGDGAPGCILIYY